MGLVPELLLIACGMIVEHEQWINASVVRVWSVTVDVESWAEWTPTVTGVTRLDEGPFGVGCRVLIKQPGMRACEWVVTALDEGKGFTWEARVYGIWMSATHEIMAQGSGITNILRLRMRGVVATMLWPLIRGSLSSALERENAGLKAVCEDGGAVSGVNRRGGLV